MPEFIDDDRSVSEICRLNLAYRVQKSRTVFQGEEEAEGRMESRWWSLFVGALLLFTSETTTKFVEEVEELLFL